jgi:hypothetical protein
VEARWHDACSCTSVPHGAVVLEEARMESAEAKVMQMQPVGPAPDGDWAKPWVAYHITKRPGMNGRVWSRIGTAWLNRDGSISLLLEAIPIDGKVNLREAPKSLRPTRPGALAVAAAAEESAAQAAKDA